MKKYSYSKSGVSINKGNQFVSEIKNILNKNVKIKTKNIGGFAGLFPINKRIKNPILVAATDGVGTKLEIANKLNKHDTIGIDLVAMCVNDIIVTRAKPIFFLDYIATGKLDLKKGKEIIKGIVKGCTDSGCLLLGGETAEMPGFYNKDKYDLAGFSVGILDKSNSNINPKYKDGDLIVGIQSSGIHSNGYSLIRKIIKDKKISLNKNLPNSNISIGKALLTPTKIYVNPILELYEKKIIKGCAHITGGGITENLPRILSKNIYAEINLDSWKLSPLFRWVKSMGISQSEMLKTFNCGYGMLTIVEKKNVTKLKYILKKYKLRSVVIGSLKKKDKDNNKDVVYSGSW